MGILTAQGYVAETFENIFNQFVAGLKKIYGNDILIDADDPDGEFAGILAQMRADVEGVILAIYQANDPDNATGVWLEQKTAFAGISRRLASYSYLRDVILDGDADTPLKAGIIVKDETGTQWTTETDVVLDGDGSAVQDFRSVELGQFSVSTDTDLTLVTIISGWDSAKTSVASEVGENEETDPELLGRFYRSRSRPSMNAIDSTVADLMALPDVKDVVPLENTSDITDENGVAPHSVNYIVDGGDNQQIAQVIYDNWPGTGLQGDISVSVNRLYSERTVDIHFDRPTPVDMATVIVLGRRKNFTFIDTVAMAENIAAMVFSTGESVYQDDIIDVIKQTEGAFARSVTYGRKGGPLADVPEVAMGTAEKARFLVTDVSITISDV